ncbi:3-hydroxyisobutyrate dehydrogenase [Sphingobium herbicidovorans NBRC 16415]|uniref:3-hydroxyisobutyrate dehydrogenase n=1 Tax=Sphingobium herbicidovorans (strain ATCC 700291 / DSM 11019 / CCUG 56400 / KCTC 2939 / LMG 18315 / NBRC 16415 / MH) TaxID=1219045 RepID=A0A086PDB6_SPHHM|nr:NAD(P)-binding domain-containing protein [Sphingobium herbicidovorans]KFG91384.1 3-hydroxyisobutyrate dehydrogenase [Sphingobium herbicidovorans NBRC 16415]
MDRIGFIGLGAMGRPMASNMARKGFNVLAYDLQPQALDAVVSAGATAASSSADVAAQSDIVFTMLQNSAQVQAVLEGEVFPNLKPGGIVVDMSTIEPSVTDRMIERAAKAGLIFVDSPVGRTTTFAERGESLLMVGAEAEHLERLEPILRSMATTIIHCGPPGHGIRIKIVNNFIVINTVQVNAEALALGAALGLDVEAELEVFNGTLATNGFLKVGFPEKTLAGDIEPGFQIDLAHKDISIAIATANELKVPLAVGAATREAINLARARGMGGKDFTPGFPMSGIFGGTGWKNWRPSRG